MVAEKSSAGSPLRWGAGSLLAGLLGFFATYTLHRPPKEAPAAAPSTPASPVRHSRPVPADSSTAGRSATAGLSASSPNLKSNDTADSLLALGDHDLYGRLALWLLDAPADEMAAFWENYRSRPGRDSWVTDLLFSQWTRLDPQGAIAAAAGTGSEGIPWWAWAMNDPMAALAAVKGNSPGMAAFVMRAIGQFHPEIAQRVLAENPELDGPNGLQGIAHGIARDDPEAAMEFMRLHGINYDTDSLERWTRLDPKAAFEWLKQNLRSTFYDPNREALVNVLKRQHPELLTELAASTPPGSLRRQLEAAAFSHLLEEKPEEALAQARASESPRLTAERLAEVGRSLVKDNPQKALELFNEMLQTCPDATQHTLYTRMPDGTANSIGRPVAGVSELIDGLLGWDPQALMAAAMAGNRPASPSGEGDGDAPAGEDARTADFVGRAWLMQDTAGFSAWLDQQEAGPARDRATLMLGSKLTETGDYAAAASRLPDITDATGQQNLAMSFFPQWIRSEPAAAAAWLEKTDLPEETRQRLTPYLQQP